MILTDRQLRGAKPVHPLLDKLSEDGVISYGLSSCGVDLRLDYSLSLFSQDGGLLDPKDVNPNLFSRIEVDPTANGWVMPPYSYVLGSTIERFQVPDDLFCIIIGKSTYARSGLIVNCTPAEPGWKGHLTVEIANPTPLHVKLYPGEGILQAVFFQLSERPDTTYGDRGGKYQNQIAEPVLPKVRANGTSPASVQEGASYHDDKSFLEKLVSDVDWRLDDSDLTLVAQRAKERLIIFLKTYFDRSAAISPTAIPDTAAGTLGFCIVNRLITTNDSDFYELAPRGEQLMERIKIACETIV